MAKSKANSNASKNAPKSGGGKSNNGSVKDAPKSGGSKPAKSGKSQKSSPSSKHQSPSSSSSSSKLFWVSVLFISAGVGVAGIYFSQELKELGEQILNDVIQPQVLNLQNYVKSLQNPQEESADETEERHKRDIQAETDENNNEVPTDVPEMERIDVKVTKKNEEEERSAEELRKEKEEEERKREAERKKEERDRKEEEAQKEAEKLEKQRKEEEKRKEQERKEQERKEQERKEQERKEQERKEQERKEQERKEQERKEQERKEQERKEQERKEQERLDALKKEEERKAAEKKEAERKEREKKEEERKEQEKKEAERKEQEKKEAERKEQEKKEQERKEAEKKEQERKEGERKEQEKKEAERKEQEKKNAEKKERERKDAERVEQEKKEKERLEALKEEEERKSQEKEEAERKEQERIQALRKEEERREAERQEKEKAKALKKEEERRDAELKEAQRRDEEARKATERMKKAQNTDAYAKAGITSEEDMKISKALDKADSLLEKEKYEEALKKFDEILATDPDSPRAVYGKGLTLDKLGFKHMSNEYLEQSITFLDRVLSLNRVPDDLLKLCGRKLAERQQFRGWGSKAVKTFKFLTQRFPDDLKLRNEFGVQYLLIGQNERAREVFKEVLAKSPDNGFAKVHVGFILRTSNNDLDRAIPMLKEGIESGEDGTSDGRFYLHLGDALLRVGNEKEARHYYKEAEDKGLFLSQWQRSLYNVKELTARPFWTPQQAGYQQYAKLLEENWQVIRGEGLSQLNMTTGAFVPEDENLRDTGDWKQLTLYMQGRKNKENCARTPKTCALIDQIPEAKGCRRGQVKFSVMSPGIHVWPHVGPTNCRLRGHLGLVVPEGPSLRVVKETRTWKEGEMFIFDDSFEHEVWHTGSELRLILIVDFWHPELTKQQRRTLTPI